MTKFEAIRNEKIAALEAVNIHVKPTKGVNSGAHGCAFELANAPKSSRKTEVSRGGRVDNVKSLYIRDENGNISKENFESKTTGGRVTSIIAALENGNDGYVVYELNICNKNTDYKPYNPPAIVCKYSVFMAALEECKAIKGATDRHGNFNGYQIQPSIKAWINWVSDYPVKWEREAVYDWFDFIEC